MSVGIIKHFSVLKDPRIERKKLHSLIDSTVLTIFAEIKSIRIDGKTLRGSKCTKNKRNPLHLMKSQRYQSFCGYWN
jgi:hypothetical protein